MFQGAIQLWCKAFIIYILLPVQFYFTVERPGQLLYCLVVVGEGLSWGTRLLWS